MSANHDDVFDADGMGRYRKALLDVCAELIAQGRVKTLHDWSKKAGIKSEATIRNFMVGRARSLAIETYAALAAYAKKPVSELLGEATPQISERERLILEGFRKAPETGKAAIEAQARREIEEDKSR